MCISKTTGLPALQNEIAMMRTSVSILALSVYGIAYRRTYATSTSWLFRKSLPSLLCGTEYERLVIPSKSIIPSYVVLPALQNEIAMMRTSVSTPLQPSRSLSSSSLLLSSLELCDIQVQLP